MNKKGFATIGILIVILFVTSMLLLLFYKPILETSKNISKSSLISNQIVKDMNGKERIYSILKENISYEGEVNYEDLNKIYNVTTIDEDYESIELHFSSHSLNGFSINNKTSIDIMIEANPVDLDESYSYDVELINNGVDLLDGDGQGLQVSSDITIPSNKIYNKSTGKFNYGTYNLNIPYTENCTVKAIVVYDKLYHRELRLIDDNVERTILISNDFDHGEDNITIEFKQGGD